MTLRELNSKRKVNFSKTFTEAYKSQNTLVNRGNFREFVSAK